MAKPRSRNPALVAVTVCCFVIIAALVGGVGIPATPCKSIPSLLCATNNTCRLWWGLADDILKRGKENSNRKILELETSVSC
jgi:hypothetical protein